MGAIKAFMQDVADALGEEDMMSPKVQRESRAWMSEFAKICGNERSAMPRLVAGTEEHRAAWRAFFDAKKADLAGQKATEIKIVADDGTPMFVVSPNLHYTGAPHGRPLAKVFCNPSRRFDEARVVYELKEPSRCFLLREHPPMTHVAMLVLWYRKNKAWKRGSTSLPVPQS